VTSGFAGRLGYRTVIFVGGGLGVRGMRSVHHMDAARAWRAYRSDSLSEGIGRSRLRGRHALEQHSELMRPSPSRVKSIV